MRRPARQLVQQQGPAHRPQAPLLLELLPLQRPHPLQLLEQATVTASKTFRICECCHASAQHLQHSSPAPAMLPQPVSCPPIYWLQLLPGLKGGDVAGGCSQGWQPSWSWGSPWGRWATADQMTAACRQSGRITICQSSLGISASTSPRYYHSLCRHLQGVSGLHDWKASAAHNSKSCT